MLERIGGQDGADPRQARGDAVGPEAQAGPALLAGVARREEQHRFERIGGLGGEQQPRVLVLELREVEECVVLLEIVVLDVLTYQVLLVRRRYEYRAQFDAMK